MSVIQQRVFKKGVVDLDTFSINYYNNYFIDDKFDHLIGKELGNIIDVDWKKRKVYIDDLDKTFDEINKKYNFLEEQKESIWSLSFTHYPPRKMSIEERKRKLDNTMKDIENKLRADLPKFISYRKLEVTSRRKEREIQEEFDKWWEEKSIIEKAAITNKAFKKPSTLKEGLILYIIIMLVECIFKGATGAMIVTTFLFLMWCIFEIMKYN